MLIRKPLSASFSRLFSRAALIAGAACCWSPLLSRAASQRPEPEIVRAEEEAFSAAAESPSPFERVVVLGASLSAGSGLRKWLDFPGDFAPVFAASVTRPLHVTSHSDVMFFEAPTQRGAELAARARAEDPTLLLALDFLFWYAHGTMPEERRPERFELGLKELEAFTCPVVVADLPDVSLALEGQATPLGGGPLIFPSMLPELATRTRLNERLRAWAAERGNVVVVPLDRFLEKLRLGAELVVGTEHWPAGKATLDQLLQTDRLHPTLEGAFAVCLLLSEALTTQSSRFERSDFRWTLTELQTALPEAARPWREAHEQEQARRAATRAAERAERKARRNRGDDG